MNIIIIEDEGITAFFLQETLSDLGHNVVGVFDNAQSLFDFLNITKETINLILMDINIQGSIDGLQASQHIYWKKLSIPIVFVTSFKDSQTIRDAQSVKPLGYLVKPISEVDLETILMVVQGYISPVTIDANEIILQDYKFNIKEKSLYKDNTIVNLSAHEQLCIEILMKNHNITTSSEQLINYIWGNNQNKISSLRELLFRLRKKLTSLEIVNIPSIGYLLQVKQS